MAVRLLVLLQYDYSDFDSILAKNRNSESILGISQKAYCRTCVSHFFKNTTYGENAIRFRLHDFHDVNKSDLRL